jgi:site-specific recombinase XerD
MVKARSRASKTSLPLAGYVRLYEAQLRSERKSPNTLDHYLGALGRFTRWFELENGEPPTLADYGRDNVRLFLGDLANHSKWEDCNLRGRQRGPLSSATVHGIVRALKTFGAWLEREEHLDSHPLLTLRLPKLDEKQLQPLTEDEERALISAYDDNSPTGCRAKAIFLLMLDTGLRLSEVTGVKAENMDLDNGFLLVMGKGRKERAIPFGYTAERMLRRYNTFFRPRPALPTVDEFFLTQDGYPLTKNAMAMLFARAKKRTGITRLHPHLLRHTYGIRAQEQGMPTITLQHYMGHSSSKVTERYVHAAQSEKLKRARGYSPVDQLRISVRRAPTVRRPLK